MKRTLLVGLFLASFPLCAQTISSNSGTAFPFLSLGLGARAVGMGESFTAVADDLSALQYNPAGLAQIPDPQLALMHNSYLDNGFYETLGFACPYGNAGVFALGLNYLNYGSIDQRDGSGNLLGTYTPYDMGVQGAVGFILDKNASLGLRSQWIRQDIAGSVQSGLLWDAGFLVKPFERFSIGADLKNLGVETGGFNLPTEFLYGLAYRWDLADKDRHSLLLSGGGDAVLQGISRLNIGFEYAYLGSYFLRGGYSGYLQDNQLGPDQGLSFGAGFKVGQFQLDYSYSFEGDLGNMQRFSLVLDFPGKPKTPSMVSAPGTGSNPLAGQNFSPPLSSGSTNRPVLLKFQVTSEQELTPEQLFDQAEDKLKLGLKKEALDLYLKVIDKDPQFQRAWMRIGKLYFDDSLAAYRKVLEMDPKNERLREWLSHFPQ